MAAISITLICLILFLMRFNQPFWYSLPSCYLYQIDNSHSLAMVTDENDHKAESKWVALTVIYATLKQKTGKDLNVTHSNLILYQGNMLAWNVNDILTLGKSLTTTNFLVVVKLTNLNEGLIYFCFLNLFDKTWLDWTHLGSLGKREAVMPIKWPCISITVYFIVLLLLNTHLSIYLPRFLNHRELEISSYT